MLKLKPNRTIKENFYIRRQVLQFQDYNNQLTEGDIFDLFVGLYKLIRNTTKIELEQKFLRQINVLKREVAFYKNKYK